MDYPSVDYTARFTRIVIRSGVALFGGISVILIAVSFFTRERLHQQILHRDAFILQKMAQAIYETETESKSLDKQFDVALRSSELSGVIAIRVFDSNGKLNVRFPSTVYRASLSQALTDVIRSNGAVTQFVSDFNPEQLFDDFFIAEHESFPVSRILIPLYEEDKNIVAIIEYWIDSENLIGEFKKIDNLILSLTPVAILLSGLMLWIILKLSLNSVQGLSRTIEKRNIALEKANAHLALSAKTSALGAISAHLFHDLKNPLAGLKAILNNGSVGDDHSGEASALTNRIQKLVNETLRFIQLDGKDYAPEFSISEFATNLEKKYQDKAFSQEAIVKIEADGEAIIPGEQIPLITLILHNLLQNAIDAAIKNKALPANISIQLQEIDERLEIKVEDFSGGIPEEIVPKLFSPMRSQKSSGSGIGLAISGELARKMNGELMLDKTNTMGSTFKLSIPLTHYPVASL